MLGYFPRDSKHFSRNLSIASGGIGAVIMARYCMHSRVSAGGCGALVLVVQPIIARQVSATAVRKKFIRKSFKSMLYEWVDP